MWDCKMEFWQTSLWLYADSLLGIVIHTSAPKLEHNSVISPDVLMCVCRDWHMSRLQYECVCLSDCHLTNIWSFMWAVYIFVSRCLLFIYSILILMYYFSVDCHNSGSQWALSVFSHVPLQSFCFNVWFFFGLSFFTWGISVVHHDSDPALVALCNNLAFTCYLNVLHQIFKCLFWLS